MCLKGSRFLADAQSFITISFHSSTCEFSGKNCCDHRARIMMKGLGSCVNTKGWQRLWLRWRANEREWKKKNDSHCNETKKSCWFTFRTKAVDEACKDIMPFLCDDEWCLLWLTSLSMLIIIRKEPFHSSCHPFSSPFWCKHPLQCLSCHNNCTCLCVLCLPGKNLAFPLILSLSSTPSPTSPTPFPLCLHF